MSEFEDNTNVEQNSNDSNVGMQESEDKTDIVEDQNGDNTDTGENEDYLENNSVEQEQKEQVEKTEENAETETEEETKVEMSEKNEVQAEPQEEPQVMEKTEKNVEGEEVKEGAEAVVETFQHPSELFPEESIKAVKESCERARQLLSESTNPSVQETLKQPLNGALASKHDDDERKIFVGGLHWETTINDLRDYFAQFGKVVDCTLKTDPTTGRSRGFGFVLFEDLEAVNKVVAEKTHVLQGKTIDPKRAVSKAMVGGAGGGKDPVKKIFVGGVSPDMSEGDIRSFFIKYGKIEEVELPFDRLKNQRRAYVFITFSDEASADEACKQPKQKLGERDVDVRRATPRSESDQGRSNRGRGRGNYDYSAYYGYPGYPNYSGYQMPGYDYSNYYGGDWSQYNQQYAQQYGYQMGQAAATPAASAATPGANAPAANPYASYDYNNWYNQQDAANKMKRDNAAPSYHPYSR